MKLVNVREARASFADLVEHAQKETVVILRHGKPVATLQGTRGADLETVMTAGSPEFWRDLEKRRKGPSRPLAELEAELAAQRRRPRRGPSKPAASATPRRKRAA